MAKTILFVEDDLPTIDVYKTALNKAGFRVQVVKLGKEAILRTKKMLKKGIKKPDLVLLDLILPDVNGIEVLREIKKHKETENIPVFVLTNYSDKKLIEMSKKLKASKFLLKADYTPTELAKFLKTKIRK